jgi:hypothetical protein
MRDVEGSYQGHKGTEENTKKLGQEYEPSTSRKIRKLQILAVVLDILSACKTNKATKQLTNNKSRYFLVGLTQPKYANKKLLPQPYDPFP